MIKENREHTIEVFKSKVSDFEFVRPELVSCQDIKVKMTTLCELAAPNLKTQPLSITIIYPVLDRPLKLDSEFLNLLPKFHGLLGEDPYRHNNEFIITC